MRKEFDEEEERAQAALQRQAILYETERHKVTELWGLLDRSEKVMDGMLDEYEEEEPDIGGFMEEADDLVDDIIEMKVSRLIQVQGIGTFQAEVPPGPGLRKYES